MAIVNAAILMICSAVETRATRHEKCDLRAAIHRVLDQQDLVRQDFPFSQHFVPLLCSDIWLLLHRNRYFSDSAVLDRTVGQHRLKHGISARILTDSIPTRVFNDVIRICVCSIHIWRILETRTKSKMRPR